MRRGYIFGVVLLLMLAVSQTGCKQAEEGSAEVKAADVKAEPLKDAKPVPVADLLPLEVVEDVASPADVVSQLDSQKADKSEPTDIATEETKTPEADVLKLPDMKSGDVSYAHETQPSKVDGAGAWA
jgi:hypothetical protein